MSTSHQMDLATQIVKAALEGGALSLYGARANAGAEEGAKEDAKYLKLLLESLKTTLNDE